MKSPMLPLPMTGALAAASLIPSMSTHSQCLATASRCKRRASTVAGFIPPPNLPLLVGQLQDDARVHRWDVRTFRYLVEPGLVGPLAVEGRRVLPHQAVFERQRAT